jgi:hypothetical protein
MYIPFPLKRTYKVTLAIHEQIKQSKEGADVVKLIVPSNKALTLNHN